MVKMPVGVSDFSKLIRKGYYFVDKTLSMSMVDWFFNVAHKDEAEGLFAGTYVASSGEKYMGQLGSKPFFI